MNEKLDILQMLHDGKISVDEASKLLEAVSGASPAPRETNHDSAASIKTNEPPPAIPPDMGRFRRWSYIPFAIALALLVLAGGGTYALYLRTGGRITFGFVLLLALCILIFLVTVLALWATSVLWLHVRIRSAPNKDAPATRFSISLPVPLTLAGWGLGIAHHFVDRDVAAHLDAAAALVDTMKESLGKPGTEPIIVDVDDGDDRVQVYIG